MLSYFISFLMVLFAHIHIFEKKLFSINANFDDIVLEISHQSKAIIKKRSV